MSRQLYDHGVFLAANLLLVNHFATSTPDEGKLRIESQSHCMGSCKTNSTKRLTAKGSGTKVPLKPTNKEGPHWRDAPRPRAKEQKLTNEEDPSQAGRQEADRSPLKPTNEEGPWPEAKS